ncbi:hypothetical protein H257_02975 [Aphanomyces astaci]|uniref:Uncharacterized protein n=1 Tax=Aphanomyces astaci TaxID=112090 RepID=W4H1L2_APHAT|nr:hypothetical protein H257_02975 [Aphanomyces astaci]ETV85129.1 hypothetical protein H257_02975 [Aphanomyces astaci]|eukprot:XP_009825147.1 hypothetical protein H257_02975 [Aphanomyces astaci]
MAWPGSTCTLRTLSTRVAHCRGWTSQFARSLQCLLRTPWPSRRRFESSFASALSRSRRLAVGGWTHQHFPNWKSLLEATRLDLSISGRPFPWLVVRRDLAPLGRTPRLLPSGEVPAPRAPSRAARDVPRRASPALPLVAVAKIGESNT